MWPPVNPTAVAVTPGICLNASSTPPKASACEGRELVTSSRSERPTAGFGEAPRIATRGTSTVRSSGDEAIRGELHGHAPRLPRLSGRHRLSVGHHRRSRALGARRFVASNQG